MVRLQCGISPTESFWGPSLMPILQGRPYCMWRWEPLSRTLWMTTGWSLKKKLPLIGSLHAPCRWAQLYSKCGSSISLIISLLLKSPDMWILLKIYQLPWCRAGQLINFMDSSNFWFSKISFLENLDFFHQCPPWVSIVQSDVSMPGAAILFDKHSCFTASIHLDFKFRSTLQQSITARLRCFF